jgi:hypothetical protein
MDTRVAGRMGGLSRSRKKIEAVTKTIKKVNAAKKKRGAR